MQSSVVVSGRILLAAVLAAGAAFAAPPSATLNTPASPAAGTPRKMDARQIDELVNQGAAALAAGDAKLARDLFLDATQADSRNARGLHGLALSYYALNEVQKAAATIDRAVAIAGALDHAMAVNAGTIHLAAKSPIRAAKIAKDYLTAKPNPVDEPVANVILVSLEKADAQARKNAFYAEVKSFYAAYSKRMEAANPGYMRFGSQWLPSEKVLEFNRTNAVQQPIVERTTRELADMDGQLAVKREQLAVLSQKIDRGAADRWADYQLKEEIREMESKRNEKKRVLDEASAKLMKTSPLPELDKTVAMDAAVPPLSKPATIAIAPPAEPPVVANDPQPGATEGPTTRRSRRFRRPPGDEGAPAEQPMPQPGGQPAAPPQQPPPMDPPAGEPPVVVAPPEAPAAPPAPKQKVKLTSYAAAFAVSPDLVVTTSAAVEGAIKISLQARDGSVISGSVLRVDNATGLALVRVTGVKLHYLDLGTPESGKITCAAFADANIFAPSAELLIGTAPAPAAQWKLKFPRHPRLAGAPLMQNGKVVGVAVGDRDSEMAAYPSVPADAIRSLLNADAPQGPGNLTDPLFALMQVSATKEREQ